LSDMVASSDSPLQATVLELGNMPDQVSEEQNKMVTLRLRLSPRDYLMTSTGREKRQSALDPQAELRQLLLDTLRIAPTVNLRANEGLAASLDMLLKECMVEGRFEAAAKTKQLIEVFNMSGVDLTADSFLQETADEISRRARQRVQLVKERHDLQKIMDFVVNHSDSLRRKNVAFQEYLEGVREQKVTVKNVYASERLQRGDPKARTKKKADNESTRKAEEERKRAEEEKIKTVCAEHADFRKIMMDDPGLSKYLESHPNLTKTQMRDLLDRRPDFVAVFDQQPEELMRIGRAPNLRLMLDGNKEIKAALDKKQEVRALLESKPDLNRSQLQELVFSNAHLKDLYDSRPELKELLLTRAQMFEEEQKSLDDLKPEAFVAGPVVRVSAKYLVKEGIVVSLSLPTKMSNKLHFEFSSVRSGSTHVIATFAGQAILAFDLQLEELLDMQYNRLMVKDQGKVKLDVNKTLVFLNERMRF